ncbi:MAG: hypothetical protein IPH89_02235 [Bacteroidetes bacterium]|nr:hypothetical protein [Bacteroidota bacterium]
MKKIIFTLFLFLISIVGAFATHNRAGEITYKHLTGNTYKITITTYTNTFNTTADRCELTVLLVMATVQSLLELMDHPLFVRIPGWGNVVFSSKY